MKIHNNNPSEKFEPIDLHVTIETKRELMLLCSLLNASGNDLRAFINRNRYLDMNEFDHPEIKEVTSPLWEFLNSNLIQC